MKTEDIKLFQQVVESGSLVKTSDALDLAKSNISRRIKSLEQEVGAKLFTREPKSMRLTEQGQVFYQKSKSLLAELEQTLIELAEPTKEVSGELRVQMVANAHSLLLANTVYQFMAKYPQVKAELITTNEELNLSQQHIDIGFSFGETLEDSSLIARRIKSAKLKLYAAPSMFTNNDSPQHLSELDGHKYIQTRLPNGKLFKHSLEAEFDPKKLDIVLVTNDVQVLLDACLSGLGIAALPVHLGDLLVKHNKLIPICDDKIIYHLHSWIMYRSNQFMPLVVRRFIDFAVEQLEKSDMPEATLPAASRFLI
ncbi:LysR family transcriptional regulator [Shewanella eurypsychrophilus]|uniref:LysR family transcriptional regulator n=1 Tax=Shewanella eurypsychrophilus TaxID=2593656 RepID=A0ABX6V3G4_9GAMM|nr:MULTISPECIES: LysR family transcriptional regulator [Shewanella]QPG57179.2 LysR family transcriptional regulator [Shewanella eurypsychrophilus]